MTQRAPSNALAVPQINLWREFTLLSVLVMDVSWVVPWFRALTPSTYTITPWHIFLVFILVILAANWLARLLNFLRIKDNLKRGIFIGLLVVSVFFGLKVLLYNQSTTDYGELINRPLRALSEVGELIPPEFLVIVAVLLLARRGISLGRGWVGRMMVFDSFRFGIIMFATFGVLITASTGESPGNLLYIFLVAGLLGLVASRVTGLSLMRGGGRNPFDSRWLTGIATATAATITIAASVAGLVINQMERLLEWLRTIFYVIVVTIAAPILMLLGLMNPALEYIQGAIPTPTPLPDILPWELEQAQTPPEENIVDAADAWLKLLAIIRPVLLVGGILIVIVIVLWKLQGWTLPIALGKDDERVSLLEGNSLLRLLMDALRNRARRVTQGLAGATRLGRRDRLRAAARIRRIYSDLMELCMDLGRPRSEAETPLEFLPTLRELFPSLEVDLVTITQGYLRVRYGELPETLQDIQLVESAWRRIRDLGVILKKGAPAVSKGT